MIKKILMLLAVPMIFVFSFLFSNVILEVLSFITNHPFLITAVIIAIIIQLVGHFFRAMRTKIITDQAVPSGVLLQFNSLSVGYLFNSLLPFRAGELVRALLVSRKLKISLLYTFAAIVIERVLDIILIGLIVLVGSLLINGVNSLFFVALGAVAVALVILIVLILLASENKIFLSFFSSVSGLFNKKISNSMRFKLWSLIFGLQSFWANKKLVKRYINYFAMSWFCYFISAFLVVGFVLSAKSMLEFVVAGVSPYVIFTPFINPLDVNIFQHFYNILKTSTDSLGLVTYSKLIWFILSLPMMAIGVFSLFSYKTKSRRNSAEKKDPYANKLMRNEDISQELPVFLESYLKGAKLSRILHKIEVRGELSLVKFYKGGSDAITVLAMKDGDFFVKKIVPIDLKDRLRVQYEWLRKYKDKKSIVKILGEQTADDYYAIDLQYNPSDISFFEYIHTCSLEQAKRSLSKVWQYVFDNIYELDEESVHFLERDEYVEERLIKKIKKAIQVDDNLRRASEESQIIINGELFDNFFTIIDKIKKHQNAWSDIATYRNSKAIHGDLTIDNILINSKNGELLIIDPSDDNQVRGPVLDFGRQVQSLVAGYEFMNADDLPVNIEFENGYSSIRYGDHKSARYLQLYDYLISDIADRYLTEKEKKSALFHAGLFYGRMLAHRVVINPSNTLKYYATSVVLLNRFYNQY